MRELEAGAMAGGEGGGIDSPAPPSEGLTTSTSLVLEANPLHYCPVCGPHRLGVVRLSIFVDDPEMAPLCGDYCQRCYMRWIAAHFPRVTRYKPAPTSEPLDGGEEMTGDQIRAAREAAGLTQKELAARLGVSKVTVGWWERGWTVPGGHRTYRGGGPGKTTYADILAALAVPARDTLGSAGDRPTTRESTPVHPDPKAR